MTQVPLNNIVPTISSWGIALVASCELYFWPPTLECSNPNSFTTPQVLYQDTTEDFSGELAEVHLKQHPMHFYCLQSQSFLEGTCVGQIWLVISKAMLAILHTFLPLMCSEMGSRIICSIISRYYEDTNNPIGVVLLQHRHSTYIFPLLIRDQSWLPDDKKQSCYIYRLPPKPSLHLSQDL